MTRNEFMEEAKKREEEQVEDYSDTWNIEPDDMPSFLNEVASKYFKDNERIRFKLAQCSAYIHGIHYNARKLVCSQEERKTMTS